MLQIWSQFWTFYEGSETPTEWQSESLTTEWMSGLLAGVGAATLLNHFSFIFCMNIHCHRYRYFLSFSHFHFRPTSRYICALHSSGWYKNPNNHNPYSSEHLRTQSKSPYSGDYDCATVSSLFTHLNTTHVSDHSTRWKLKQKNVRSLRALFSLSLM